MNKDKLSFINTYVLPALGAWAINCPEFYQQLAMMSRLHKVVKYQVLETPGPVSEGRIWFSATAMVHSFYYCPLRDLKIGTRVWKKRTFIWCTTYLTQEEERTDYLQALEAGQVLSISQPKLVVLVASFPEMEQLVYHLTQHNALYYQQHSLFLAQAATVRVHRLHKEHPLFIRVSSRDTQAMHANLSKSGYLKLLKAIGLL